MAQEWTKDMDRVRLAARQLHADLKVILRESNVETTLAEVVKMHMGEAETAYTLAAETLVAAGAELGPCMTIYRAASAK